VARPKGTTGTTKAVRLARQRQAEASSLELILDSIDNGRIMAIDYVRQLALTDDRYRDLIHDYDADPTLDLGDLCLKHKILPVEFWTDINKEMFPVADEALKFGSAMATHEIAKRMGAIGRRAAIEGTKAEGVFDRHQLLMKTGQHLAPKAASININQVNQQAAGLPSFEDETKELASILSGEVTEDHLLTEGETEYVECETVEERERIPA
jgi:hypothetical protein